MDNVRHTLYEVIGIPGDAAHEEIERACIQLGHPYRPDLNKEDATAREKFAIVDRIFTTLSEPAKRVAYDEALRHGTPDADTEAAFALADYAYEVFCSTDGKVVSVKGSSMAGAGNRTTPVGDQTSKPGRARSPTRNVHDEPAPLTGDAATVAPAPLSRPSFDSLQTESLPAVDATDTPERQPTSATGSVEIYLGELNDKAAIDSFLRGHVYGFAPLKGDSGISKAVYFAPHFGQKVAQSNFGIFCGISYVARIDAVDVANTWESFLAVGRKHRGAGWIKKHKDLLDDLERAWTSDEKQQRTIVFLGTPRLVFNPPINKVLLQKGRGRLSRRTFSFDELFEAWSKSATGKVE